MNYSSNRDEYSYKSPMSEASPHFASAPTTPVSDLAPPITKNGEVIGQQKPVMDNKKTSRLAKFSNIFKPWKWKKRKKPCEKLQKTAVELERKISVRTSREELIERGVLHDVDELPKLTEEQHPTTESKDGKGDCDVQANGGPTSTSDECKQPLSSSSPPSTLPRRPASAGSSSGLIGDPPDTPDSTHYHVNTVPNSCEMHRPESAIVQPQQVRVMLPMDHPKYPAVHYQETDYSPVSVNTLPASNNTPLNNNTQIYTPPPTSSSSPGYNSTPRPQSATLPAYGARSSSGDSSPVVTTGGRIVSEVPVNEPDLSKRPLRSALKGAKNKEMFQRQLADKLKERQLQQQLSLELSPADDSIHAGSRPSTLPRPPPVTAPKPKGVRICSSSGDQNKENQQPSPVTTGTSAESYDNVPDYDNLNDSSSDEESVRWRDDDCTQSILAAKVQRSDSLARFLSQRPDRGYLIERNILPPNNHLQEKQVISTRLNRRLSLRPSAEELEAKNILHKQTPDEIKKQREEMKKTLIRKLSFRPTVEELRERKIIRFNDYVEVTEAEEMDRRADKPWTRLTPKDKAMIRRELNDFKSAEMDVHEESRKFTRFHRP